LKLADAFWRGMRISCDGDNQGIAYRVQETERKRWIRVPAKLTTQQLFALPLADGIGVGNCLLGLAASEIAQG